MSASMDRYVNTNTGAIITVRAGWSGHLRAHQITIKHEDLDPGYKDWNDDGEWRDIVYDADVMSKAGEYYSLLAEKYHWPKGGEWRRLNARIEGVRR